jgi:hypothetical protein
MLVFYQRRMLCCVREDLPRSGGGCHVLGTCVSFAGSHDIVELKAEHCCFHFFSAVVASSSLGRGYGVDMGGQKGGPSSGK